MRYEILDEVRGITLLNMILYHTVWDLVYILGFQWFWFYSDAAYVWQQSICWMFILLSGFCWPLGKKTWRRGLIVFGAGVLITVMTGIFSREQMVIFGVLTFLGSAMLLLLPLKKLLFAIKPIVGLVGSMILFILLRNVNSGYLGFEQWRLVRLPEILYQNYLTTFLGFPMKGFVSADYFAVFPWIFLYTAGFFLYRVLQERGELQVLHRSFLPAAGIIGKRSLFLYLLHQPLIYGVLLLIN